MSLKKLCDRTLSYLQNKHIYIYIYIYIKGYCYCVHPYKNLSTN